MSYSNFKMLLLFVLLFPLKDLSSQTFTWSGTTTPYIQYGQNVGTWTYKFSYQNISSLNNPTLYIYLDDVGLKIDPCVRYDACPSSWPINFPLGSHKITFVLGGTTGPNCWDPTITYQTQNVNVVTNYQMKIENDFVKQDGSGGKIFVNDANEQKTAPFYRSCSYLDNFIIGAIEQSDGVYNRVWNQSGTNNSFWQVTRYESDPVNWSNNQNTTYTYHGYDFNARLTALLKKVCNITFTNNFIGGGTGGIIIVNGTQYNSPANGFTVVEQNPDTATALDQTINGIDYTFSGWYEGTTLISTQKTYVFHPGNHATYTAKFVGTPNHNITNLSSNAGTVGASPTVTWTDNVNPNVYYKIYTQTCTGGIWSDWSYVRDVAKGVGRYVDPYHIIMSGKVLDFAIKVNAFYSTEATTVTFGITNFVASENFKRNFAGNQSGPITEYKLYDNFPNPFNPSTEINYQIPTDGNVKLKVYNMVGQEVMTLVNGFKEKGMYTATFNAGNLASGLYMYRLEAGNFVQVKKMLLTK